MNIIQVHSSDGGGGAESVVRHHHQELLRRRYRTHLLVGRKMGGDPDTTQIPFLRGPRGLLRAARWLERMSGLQNLYSPSFRRLSDAFPFVPDILHIHSLHGVESFADLSAIPSLSESYPTVVSLHDLWLMTGHCGHPLDCSRWKTGCGACPDLTLYPAVSRDATAWNFRRKKRSIGRAKLNLIVPSQWLKAQVESSPVLSTFSVTVVPNPVDTDNFCPGDAAQLRISHGVTPNDRTVMLVAQHFSSPYKGMAEGIEAINNLRLSDVKVILVGHDANEAARRIRSPTVVLPFTSNSIELAGYYRMADVLLMPSRGETFGLVAAEAMACGVPVVAPAIGGLVDVLGNNQGGILTAVGSTAEMTSAIQALLLNPELRGLCSLRGRQRAVEQFRQELHTERCLAVYSETIDRFRSAA